MNPESEPQELGSEFSEQEAEKLGALKQRAEEGEIGGAQELELSQDVRRHLEFVKEYARKRGIGGAQDFPRERNDVMHSEPQDFSWENLPPELLEEYYQRFGREAELQEFKERIKEGSAFMVSESEQPAVLLMQVLQEKYSELGLSIKRGFPYEGQATVFFDKSRHNEILYKLALLEQDPVVKALADTMERGDTREVVELEGRGEFPPGANKRLLANSHIEHIKAGRWMLENARGVDADYVRDVELRIEAEKQIIQQLGVEPYSDEELRSILEERAVKTLGPPKQEA